MGGERDGIQVRALLQQTKTGWNKRSWARPYVRNWRYEADLGGTWEQGRGLGEVFWVGFTEAFQGWRWAAGEVVRDVTYKVRNISFRCTEFVETGTHSWGSVKKVSVGKWCGLSEYGLSMRSPGWERMDLFWESVIKLRPGEAKTKAWGMMLWVRLKGMTKGKEPERRERKREDSNQEE